MDKSVHLEALDRQLEHMPSRHTLCKLHDINAIVNSIQHIIIALGAFLRHSDSHLGVNLVLMFS